jgi:hypothetical protein
VTTHDGPAATSRRAAVRDREDALVARLQALGTAVDGEPDPAFRAATRQRLVAMAAVRTPEQQAERPSFWRRLLVARADDAPPARWRGRLTAGLATAALTVTAVATLVAVSTGAHPGDVLYGLKRGTEQTQLALAGDSRGQTLLDFAGTRLQEVRALGPDGDAALAVSTLRTMDQQTTDGAAWLTRRAVQTRSSAPVRDLTTWTATQRAGVADLQSAVPPGARDAAAASLDLLDRVDARAAALVPALDCSSGPAVRGSDALGPLPVTCAPVSAPAGAGPGSGTSGSQVPSGANSGSAAVPPGAATVTGAPGSAGSGSPSGGPVGTDPGGLLPGGGSVAPSPPTSIITVPLPTLPNLPLPGQPTSGSGSGTTGSTGGSSPTGGSGGIGVCLPPVLQVGNC